MDSDRAVLVCVNDGRHLERVEERFERGRAPLKISASSPQMDASLQISIAMLHTA